MNIDDPNTTFISGNIAMLAKKRVINIRRWNCPPVCTHENWDILAEVIRTTTSLEELHFDQRTNTALQNDKVVDAIANNRTIKTLYLWDASVGDEGVKVVAAILKKNSAIESVSLGYNKISDDGAKAIAEALKENTSLQKIDFSCNNIGEEGGKHILKALQQIERSAIENVELRWNQISDDTIAKINQEMTSIQKFQKFFKSAGFNEGQLAVETTEDGGIQGDENASSSNVDEWLPTHATNASQVADWSLDDQQSNETAHDTNTTVTETKMSQGDCIAENNQESNETGTKITVAQEGNEIASVMMGRSQMMQEMLYIIDSSDALRTENIATLSSARGIEIVGKDWGSPAYTDENWDILAEVIRSTSSLEKLDFQCGAAFALQNKRVIHALVQNRSIKTLSLFWGGSNDKGAKVVAAILKENSTIEAVKLYNNKITREEAKETKITREGVKEVAEALKVNKTLRSVDLSRNQIGVGAAKAIANALKVNKTLRSVDLSRNQLGVGAAKAIANALKENTSLQSIYLYGNKIGVDGAKAIAEALKDNTCLQSMDLDKNEIGNEGAMAIAGTLKENASLRELYVGWNNICDEGAKAIAEALKANTSLQELNIQGNNIGKKGGQHILNALQQIEKSAIKKIDLDYHDEVSDGNQTKINQEIIRIQNRLKSVGVEATEDGGIQGDKNASSSNEDEGLTTIRATNASQVSVSAESDRESTRKNIKAMESKIREQQLTIAQQQAELAQKGDNIAQRDKEIAFLRLEQSQMLQQLEELKGGSEALGNYTNCCVCLEPYEEGPTSLGSQRLPIKSATCAHSLCEGCLDDIMQV
jgi:Ran GTPase-activating protein (RanGAP) involved in mRNA processing and transport